MEIMKIGGILLLAGLALWIVKSVFVWWRERQDAKKWWGQYEAETNAWDNCILQHEQPIDQRRSDARKLHAASLEVARAPEISRRPRAVRRYLSRGTARTGLVLGGSNDTEELMVPLPSAGTEVGAAAPLEMAGPYRAAIPKLSGEAARREPETAEEKSRLADVVRGSHSARSPSAGPLAAREEIASLATTRKLAARSRPPVSTTQLPPHPPESERKAPSWHERHLR
jgi:hypothetical protein